MTTELRAMCAELHAALEKHDLSLADDQLLDRSAAALRAALAQPEPPELTDEEIAKAAMEALDSYEYNTELPYFLEEHASEHEPIMLAFRAVIAAARARRQKAKVGQFSTQTLEQQQ